MKLRPAQLCCGCFSLLVGVEVICLLNLITNIMIIAVASSQEQLNVGGVAVSTGLQVFNGAWALLGIPIIIGAGVGMLYRIESHLRVYFWYSLATFFINTFCWLGFLIDGAACTSMVSRDVQRMGTAFVCGMVDTFVFFWMLIGIVISLYCVYMIWSAAEETGRSSYPDLIKYSKALKGSMMPLPNKPMPPQPVEHQTLLQSFKPAAMYGSGSQAMHNKPTMAPLPHHVLAGPPISTVPPTTHAPSSMPLPGAMPTSFRPTSPRPTSGTPQSFVPMPYSQMK